MNVNGKGQAVSDYEMTYSGPQLMLETAVGPVQVTFTEAGHAYAGAGGSSGRDPGDVVYRGRHWYVSVHLYAATGWTEDPGNPEYGSYRHQFTEVGTFGGKEVPRTYRAKIAEAIEAAVRAYAEANPGTLHAAEINHLEHELDSASKDAQKLATEYGEAERKVTGLERKLARARLQLVKETLQTAAANADPMAGQAVAHGQAIRQSAGDPAWHGGA